MPVVPGRGEASSAGTFWKWRVCVECVSPAVSFNLRLGDLCKLLMPTVGAQGLSFVEDW